MKIGDYVKINDDPEADAGSVVAFNPDGSVSVFWHVAQETYTEERELMTVIERAEFDAILEACK